MVFFQKKKLNFRKSNGKFIPVQVEGGNLRIVAFVIREVEVIGEGLLFPREPATKTHIYVKRDVSRLNGACSQRASLMKPQVNKQPVFRERPRRFA